MSVTDQQLLELRHNFNPGEIKFRVGSVSQQHNRGLALAYVDARTVQERLDNVVGPANWKVEYQCQAYTIYKKTRDGKQFAAESHAWTATLSINTANNGWVGKTDGAEQTAMEQVKGGMSDAFKRAAVAWGIGRSLYSFPSDMWCDVKRVGRSWVLSGVPQIPQWYLDGHQFDPAKRTADADGPEPEFHNDEPAPQAQAAPQQQAEVQVPPNNANPFGQEAAKVPANMPNSIPASGTIGFGKKVMPSGRPIKDYTWGEIALMPADSDERGYVEWMAKMAVEKRNEGKDPFKAMIIAEAFVEWMQGKDAQAAHAAAEEVQQDTLGGWDPNSHDAADFLDS